MGRLFGYGKGYVGEGGGLTGVTVLITLTVVFDCMRDLVPVGFKIPKVGLKITGLIAMANLCFLGAPRMLTMSMLHMLLAKFVFKGKVSVVCDLTKTIIDLLTVTLMGGVSKVSVMKIDVAKNIFRGVKRVLITVSIIRGLGLVCCLPILLMTKAMAKFIVKVITKGVLPIIGGRTMEAM